eukprot:scaffold8263_cov104-Isochrysis_galbana.AAC.7
MQRSVNCSRLMLSPSGPRAVSRSNSVMGSLRASAAFKLRICKCGERGLTARVVEAHAVGGEELFGGARGMISPV